MNQFCQIEHVRSDSDVGSPCSNRAVATCDAARTTIRVGWNCAKKHQSSKILRSPWNSYMRSVACQWKKKRGSRIVCRPQRQIKLFATESTLANTKQKSC